jgi:flagellar basal-body rod protein FlgC
VVFQVNPSEGQTAGAEIGGVRVAGIIQDNAPMKRMYDPSNPLADAQGYITMPNVDPVAETVNMISASRSYQANVEVLNTAKALMQKTLTIGQ